MIKTLFRRKKMGCTNSKSVSTAVSEPTPRRGGGYDDILTSFNQQNGSSMNPSTPARSSGAQRPPIATPQDILMRGQGNSHDALCAYSWNGRNNYGVVDGKRIISCVVVASDRCTPLLICSLIRVACSASLLFLLITNSL